MQYNKVNNLFGWLCFAIATLTYVLTLDPSASFWDCGEFIASAYRLQVEHQPGAPLISMIQRVFSFLAFGDRTKIAYFMNLSSALASAGTILFLFWTITALAKKTIVKRGEEVTKDQMMGIIGAGVVGALAYTFSDSFWFSAVEAEVYAMSSLCTAVTFWAILKWESQADEPKADRWLLFIAYLIGLSIGVHILILLIIPAVVFVYYFKKTPQVTNKGIFKVLFVSILILAFVLYGIILYMVSIAAYIDLYFVNKLGFGFNSGVIFFAIILIGSLVWGIRYSIKKQKKNLNLALVSIALIIFGYTSFATLIIRSHAQPNLNNSNPGNVFSFLSYISREQYGSRPLLFGQNYNSEKVDLVQGSTIYRKGDKKYEIAGTNSDYTYKNKTILPRMYSDRPSHVEHYKEWMRMSDDHNPTFLDNLGYMLSFQTGHMYMRYFFWNFVGRQNNEEGQGSVYEGQWLSGIKPIDGILLGNQTNLPPSIVDNKAYNRFFFLPLIIGIFGAVWHFKRNQKDAGIVALFFIFTGIAIVVYLNSIPQEPRERDYAYTGSFYAFAIWIGLGVLGLKEKIFDRFTPKNAMVVSIVVALFGAPIIMAAQGWDDHDRSGKYVARDIAINYLESCAPNAILFTYGDNDTYPLWYAQEVENIRPDVRVLNLSLFDTDWYIDGLKRKQNESEPLPITMKNEQYVQGVRDVCYYQDFKIQDHIELSSVLSVLLSDNEDDKLELQDGTMVNVLPTKKFKLTVNPQDVLATKTLSAAALAKVEPALEWNFNQGYVTKGNLALFDILVHNNWKRPIYFASTVPNDQYIGLDKYLYSEGLALRLLPLKPDTALISKGEELVNTEKMYKNVLQKFKWGGIKDANYLDRQSADDVSIFSNIFNNLITALLREGKTEEAKNVVNKYYATMPTKFYGLRTIIASYYFAENLYTLKETQKANEMIARNADYIVKELNYYVDISNSKKRVVGAQNVQAYMSFLAQMARLTHENGQTKLSNKYEQKYEMFRQKFNPFFGPE
ncbi:MAG: DUF2723 domain-containing protein [Sphingobacteriaceae bacterium]|nr:DUF2723 domain-containing protein [Sphingobacteriaceae bacterium]